MSPPAEFLLGVVEGFYGRSWSHRDRLDYARLQRDLGFNATLYCPKDDARLRKRWREDWDPGQWRQLLQLAQVYQEQGISWGVGLSPFELYRCYDAVARRDLKRKIERLNELDGTLLAVLFDDMPGDIADLAERQLEIIADVRRWSGAQRLLVCPTYYSSDPVLEKFFGCRPAGYWQRLGEGLAADIDLFWTGSQVCSEQVGAGELDEIGALFRRRPVLWDNYPVNDGAQRSNFLYLEPLYGRDARLREALRGHFCNPMNQAFASLPALFGLSSLYRLAPADGNAWLARELGERDWQLLQRDRAEFRQQGLGGMGESRRAQLAAEYEASGGPAGREVAAWLRGEYTFDPACLTD